MIEIILPATPRGTHPDIEAKVEKAHATFREKARTFANGNNSQDASKSSPRNREWVNVFLYAGVTKNA